MKVLKEKWDKTVTFRTMKKTIACTKNIFSLKLGSVVIFWRKVCFPVSFKRERLYSI